jgi:hypothetical protein
MPAFSVVSGKAIQLYHFEMRWLKLTSYVVIAAALLALWQVRTVLSRRWLAITYGQTLLPRAYRGPLLTLMVALVAGHYSLSRGYVSDHRHPRPGTTLGAPYKQDLVALVGELKGNAYADKVLATFDHAVYLWWTSFADRFVFVADPFLTTRPDAEQEIRLMAAFDTLGVRPAQFRTLIQSHYFQIMWLSSAKYNVSSAYHLAPLSGYAPHVASIIMGREIDAGWWTALPLSELRRFENQYKAGEFRKHTFKPPGVVVLNSEDIRHGFRPPAPGFRLKYKNHTFQVWVGVGGKARREAETR